ncbi:MAG: polyprenyl synthetase family protein [Lachnospiraceae bacterium]|nr:polyprenyl synthetase family protein [Lachnospiraceae bacterium]
MLEEKTREVQEIVYEYLPVEAGFASELAKAMNYSMTAGGKRIRPLLMQESYQLFGGRGTDVYPFMAAIEMIHTHSLIHDDLPAIDNDEYRRGRKTTHVVFGEAMGVLAGDALLNYAYETALKAFEKTDYPKECVRALKILSQKTGIYGMLGGQSVDVTNEKQGRFTVDEEMLNYIYENKTSALIEASLMAGAALAGAGEEQIRRMEQIGSDVGIAFQIEDDILDITSTVEELGKPVFSDEKNQKTTYVTLFGVEEARAKAEYLTNQAIERLNQTSVSNEKAFLTKLLEYLVVRRK